MRAVGFREFGDVDVLEVIDLPKPPPREGEVLVEVVAATVNPTDVLMRAGAQAALLAGIDPPYVAGMEFAGRIVDIGEGVSPSLVNRPVMGVVNKRRPQGGTHAQFVALPLESVAVLDPSLDLVDAATIPMNGLAAVRSLELTGLGAGETLLVTGAAGALGGYIIQLARMAGITVIADALPADHELIEGLGADIVVPRGEAMADEIRNRVPGGVDGVIDAGRVGESAAQLVRDGGVMVHVRGTDAVPDTRIERKVLSVADRTRETATLEELAGLASRGALTPRVAVRLPFEEAKEAYRLVERGGLRGRVVLTWSS